MKALAQLPTPTIATRTFPSSVRWPFVEAPLCGPSVMRAKSSSGRVVKLRPGPVRVTPSRLSALRRATLQFEQLAADMPDALAHGEGCESRHSVDGRLQQFKVSYACPLREDEADGEDHHPHRSRREAHLALE